MSWIGVGILIGIGLMLTPIVLALAWAIIRFVVSAALVGGLMCLGIFAVVLTWNGIVTLVEGPKPAVVATIPQPKKVTVDRAAADRAAAIEAAEAVEAIMRERRQ